MTAPATYPVEPWAIVEEGIDLDALGRTESLFALSNGHVGVRGNLDEGEPRGLSGTYLNGFYESYPLEYGERGYGFAEDGQAILDVPDGKIIRLQVEDEPLDVHRGDVEFHERRLDLRTGILTRRLRWRSAFGHAVQVTTRRLVSLSLRSVVAISYEVEALEGPVRIALQSNLQAEAIAGAETNDPRRGRSLNGALESLHYGDHGMRVVLVHRTRRSGLTVASGMEHVLRTEGGVEALTRSEDDLGRVTLATRLDPGRPLRLTKFLSYHWSSQQSPQWLRDQVNASLESALAEGFDGLAAAQRETLDNFWHRGDIQLDGDPRLQQALRFAMFHLYQASVRGEGRAIPAKGLTGTGYDGHAFWDSEAFVLPVLTYTTPEAVRDALRWRHSILPEARERATQLGLRGAAMPWRTIHGEECSGYWPAGTAAFHVNADIAAAVARYCSVTGDKAFEAAEGLELLVETARLWDSLGYTDPEGAFRIDGVTGPDEYSALVDNNVFTNLMAQANLRSAAHTAKRHPEAAADLEVTREERERWLREADAMFIPYDEERGIHPQDQDFLAHELWDFENTPDHGYPLLLNYPYMQLYRKQVVKQADLVLAMHLRGDAFTPEQKRRNFDYYETITVRDSSLSAATQAVIAAEVGHLELAKDYLVEAALIDLDDLAHNTDNGLHMASLAGAVIATVSGLGGLREFGGRLGFNPRLAPGLTRLGYAVQIRGMVLQVEVTGGEAAYRLPAGGDLVFSHWGERVELEGPGTVRLPIPEAPSIEPPTYPRGRAPRRPLPASEEHADHPLSSQPDSPHRSDPDPRPLY